MKKNYIQFSKKIFNKVINKTTDTNIKLIEVESYLKSIRSFIDLTDEEMQIIRKCNEILLEKTEKLEEILEDENNEFYNLDSADEVIE